MDGIEGVWGLLRHLKQISCRTIVVIAPSEMHAHCPVETFAITRETVLETDNVYLADSIDDISEPVQTTVDLIVYNVRLPRFRVRRLFRKHGVCVYPWLTWLDSKPIGSDTFFETAVRDPFSITGAREADAFIDDWGWRFGEVCNASGCGLGRLKYIFSWKEPTTTDEIRAAVMERCPNGLKFWFLFPANISNTLYFQDSDPFRYVYRGQQH